VREIGGRSRIVKLVLSSFLDLDAFYAKHPPKPFAYYVLYPLLFPYWLGNATARREFWMYKGYTLASFGLLLASLALQYMQAFPPQLGVDAFVPIGLKSLGMEALVILVFLMPIATTVVHFHQKRSFWPLAFLALVGVASTTRALLQIHARRDPVVSYATRERVILRTEARATDAEHAQASALKAAWKALPKDHVDVDRDGKVEPGPALDAARAALSGFYKNDEAYAFDLWLTAHGKRGVLVLYFEARRKAQPIWLALDGGTTITHAPGSLPKGAFDAMWRLTQ
jgi:hypothetical protein